MADIKISQMTAGTPDENTLFEGSLDGGGGVYNTRSVSASALATLLNTTMQYGGLSTTDDTIVGSINEVAKDHNVSDEYDSTQTYVVGDLCIYGNNLFECNTDITTPEPFDANKWTQTTLADKIDEIVANANTVHQYTASYTHASITSGNIYAYSVGKIYMLTGYMRANAIIASNTIIGNVTGVTLANEIFSSSIGENGTGLRLLNYSNGGFRIERQMPANEWFSFTLVGFLA